jgi:TRAP-type C4-dicarboxylate transport system permease small subunit
MALAAAQQKHPAAKPRNDGPFEKLIRFIGWLTGGPFCLIITLVTVYGVVSRYIFRSPVLWTTEICGYLLLWSIWLGTSYTQQIEGHVIIDLCVSRANPRAKKQIYILAKVLTALFLVLFTWITVQLTISNIHSKSPSLLCFPMVWAYVAMPIGSVLFIAQTVIQIFKKEEKEIKGDDVIS